MKSNITVLYIDLFCGAGGTTTGVNLSRIGGRKCAEVIACVNHDVNAIASHQANHPDALHFTEDIRTLELSPLVKHLEKMKKKYPEAKTVLWASLECTNFSNAKGGQPRDADSRTLAEHLFRYMDVLDTDYIYIENVKEFMYWGELDQNGKPLSKDQGRSYMRWVNKVKSYGYDYDWRLLNAADYGAYTSRRRFFGIFAKHGLPITFPHQTHAKNGDEGGLFHQYKKWNAVRKVLDLDDEGMSIFAKKKPLCEKTLERIYAGLVKFIAGGKQQHDDMILKYNSMNSKGNYKPVPTDQPSPTVACQNRLGYVKFNFLSKQYSGDSMSKNQSIEKPAGTITCIDHHAFLSVFFGNGYNSSIDSPAPTETQKDRNAFVSVVPLNNSSIDVNEPMPDVPLENVSLVTERFMASEYSGGGQISSLETVNPSVLCNPKQKLVSADQFLMNPYSFKSDGGSIDTPCFTLIARMDKMPPYIITTDQGELGIVINENDSRMTVEIKKFMALYGIVDIKMRMLNIQELKRIQGFPDDYILIGTQAEQKKFLGNAVEVNMSRALCEALAARLLKEKERG